MVEKAVLNFCHVWFAYVYCFVVGCVGGLFVLYA